MFNASTKRRLALATSLAFGLHGILSSAQAGAWVNEFHYDNSGGDVGEFFEIAGAAGTDLNGWSLELYNGSSSQRNVYNTLALSGILGNDQDGFGFFVLDLPSNGIQNGSPDGFALVDSAGSVVEFLSYEGSFTAVNGSAANMTSTDIGVSENGGTPIGFSLQRTGTGSQGSDFTWVAPGAQTKGAANTGQTFGMAPPPPPPPPPPPAPTAVAIYDIQGAGHTSAFEGQDVETRGIVTGLKSNGFYLQDATGDGNDSTSDGIFIFTGGAPNVNVGDDLTISGEVSEFLQSGNPERLTVTQIANPDAIVLNSSDNALPSATIIGAGGRTPPTEKIDSDSFGTFNPETDGIDYYESLEGMLVQLPNAQTVAGQNRFGEVYAVGEAGANATGMNAFGGITLGEGDMNPERLQIQDNLDFEIGDTEIGDNLGDITGHIDYSFADYELVVQNNVDVVTAANNVAEVTTLLGDSTTMTVATYNVLQLAAGNTDQIAALAQQIVNNMGSPDVIGLQELTTGFAQAGAQELIDAIVAAGGPQYQLAFVDGSATPFNDASIQPAFLYSDRVTLDGVELMPNGVPTSNSEPFDGGQRIPLVGTFTFNGETFTIVNNHFDSRIGSSPAFGAVQPAVIGGEADRLAQAALVNAFVDGFLADNPDGNVLVLGDFNAFGFEEALRMVLEGLDGVLTNLDYLVEDATDRFTFNFEGNAQALDHIFASMNILEEFGLSLDFLHINSLFGDSASDHDPILLAISTAQPIPVPAAFWAMLFGAGVIIRRRRAS